MSVWKVLFNSTYVSTHILLLLSVIQQKFLHHDAVLKNDPLKANRRFPFDIYKASVDAGFSWTS